MDATPSYLYVKRLTETAQLPKRGSAGAAGYDLYSDDVSVTIEGKKQGKISLGISMSFSKGYYMRIAPRSSLAAKHGIDVGAGVVDVDYRGHVSVILFNFSDEPFTFVRGDRIAQMIMTKIATPEVEEVSDLDDTSRGTNGFGSTGLRDAEEKK